MPSPPNTRDLDPELAPTVAQLKATGAAVHEIDEARQRARAARRAVAAAAFESGISWRRIAQYAGYGSAQAAQQDVMNSSVPRRRSGD